MTEKGLRFCLIGAGRAGLVHARNLHQRIRTATLSAVCDPNQEARDQAADELDADARFTDYRDACASRDLDAVIIATPTFLHHEIACEAARHGKHVFLEKPMAITVDECRAMNDVVAEAGVKLQVGYMRRFDEGFVRAKELIDSGEMGRVMTIKSTSRGPGLPPPWIYDIEKCNGILAEVNSHDFDCVRWFAGSEIVRVYAEADNFKCRDAKDEWPRFYDNAVVALRFENGTLGTIDGACPCGYGYDASVEVLCENGLLLVGRKAEEGVTEIRLDGTVQQRAVRSWRNLFKDAYIAELEHFIECVEQDKTPSVTGADGLKAVEAVVAANESIRQQAPVAVGARSA